LSPTRTKLLCWNVVDELSEKHKHYGLLVTTPTMAEMFF
jgi:hypothetical protein